MPVDYRLEFHPKAVKEFADLPKADQRRIREDLLRLTWDPRPEGRAVQLAKSVYRIPTGRYRSIYHVFDIDRRVLVLIVGHRRYVYDVFDRSARE